MSIFPTSLPSRTTILVVVIWLLSACQTVPSTTVPRQVDSELPAIPAIDTSQLQTLAELVPALLSKRAVFVGESHDQYHHHLSQLSVIKALYDADADLAIGMEFFQQPFQSYLDAYVAGEIDEETMLEKTEYFERWRFDYRLYQPILTFARAHKIPIIALNLPQEITQKVGRGGLESLNTKERSQIPAAIDRSVKGYRDRIESVFNQHPGMGKRSIENFINVQLLWDEGMAETAANYLKTHPQKKMVILAGAGHINYRSGIPTRLERRIQSAAATIVLGDQTLLSKDLADYVLFPPFSSLPPSGLIGVGLEPAKQGMKIVSISKSSHAKKAGIKKGDQIIKIESRTIHQFTDIRLAIWNKAPGDKIQLTVLRNPDSDQEKIDIEIELIRKPSH